MITITTTEGLAAFCDKAAAAPYVTVDTEFLRERTYTPSFASSSLRCRATPKKTPFWSIR